MVGSRGRGWWGSRSRSGRVGVVGSRGKDGGIKGWG